MCLLWFILEIYKKKIRNKLIHIIAFFINLWFLLIIVLVLLICQRMQIRLLRLVALHDISPILSEARRLPENCSPRRMFYSLKWMRMNEDARGKWWIAGMTIRVSFCTDCLVSLLTEEKPIYPEPHILQRVSLK